MNQKVLVVGDLHGRYELAEKAYETFLEDKYDRAIFLGDYMDSHDRPDADIVNTMNIVLSMKENHPEQVDLLIGNHDEPYFHVDNNQQYVCSGFRPSVHRTLGHILTTKHRHFSYAVGMGRFLFTHAGVTYDWFTKHYETLELWAGRMNVDITDMSMLHLVLDQIKHTRDRKILFEIGPDRGGQLTACGGPLWCDKTEIMECGPIAGLNQVVGHTAQRFINRQHVFEGNKRYKNTSVTFIDCLSYRHQFLTLNIDDTD